MFWNSPAERLMTDQTLLIEETTTVGVVDWHPVEEIRLFPLPHQVRTDAPHWKPSHLIDPDPEPAFGCEDFSPRWWPGPGHRE